MGVTDSPSTIPVTNSMTNTPLVLGEEDVFQPSVVLKTPSAFPSPITLPVPISNSNGYTTTEIKAESPSNVGGVVVGVPSVFDPIPVTKEEKPGVPLLSTSEGKVLNNLVWKKLLFSQ